MTEPLRAVPMIHVPDVRATVAWYRSVGFRLEETYADGGDGWSFAIMSFGDSQVMFNSGGTGSEARRREVDLYAYCADVDGQFDRLPDHIEVVEDLHDTFYGNREFIVRDVNGFWVTFAQVLPDVPMQGTSVHDGPG